MADDEESDEDYEEAGSDGDTQIAKFKGMAYEKTTTRSVRMAATVWEEKLQRQEEDTQEKLVDPGLQEPDALESLRRVITRRFGSLTRGWRELVDKRGAHRVGRADFFAVLRDLGFKGNAKAAWCKLTGASLQKMTDPKSRQATLADFDPKAARLLSEFFRCYTEEIGKLPGLVGKSDGKRVSEAEFVSRCNALTLEHFGRTPLDLKGVFKHLNSHNAVTEADLEWLTDYCTREKPTRAGAVPPSKENKKSRAKANRARALQAFRELIQHKCGSIVAGWRKVLDPESKGELTTEDFEAGARRLQFKGSVADVWDACVVDKGHSKQRFPRDEDAADEESEEEEEDEDDEDEDEYCLHLGDLEPAVVDCIHAWQEQCTERYGSMVKAFEDMDAAKKPLVTKEEFIRFCNEICFNHNKHLLWDALDERNVGAILLSDLDATSASKVFAEEDIQIATKMHAKLSPVRKGHITLRQRAAKQCGAVKRPPEEMKSGLDTLQKQLLQRFDSPVRAWASILDPKNKGKVKMDDFIVGCSAAGFRGSRTQLAKELGLEKGGSVRFKNVGSDAIEECKDFKQKAEGKIGAVIKSIEAQGAPELKKVGLKMRTKGFQKICSRIDFEGDPEKVFKHLDISKDGHLSTKFLKLMDSKWNEEKVVSNILKKHLDLKQKRQQQQASEKAVPPVAQLKAKQDSLLIAGREKRGKKTQEEALKKELFRFLDKNVGSAARAWRLAFDPENRGEVEEGDFLAGLQRTGFIDPEAGQDDVEKGQRLFKLLADEETGVVTMEILDHRTTHALYQFRCHLASRYGGVKAAFLEIDPTGTGIISKEQFRFLCHEARMTDNARRLLEYLDPEDQDEIKLDQIDEEAAKQAKEMVEELAEAREAKKEIDERKGRTHMKGLPPEIGVACGADVRRQERQREAGQKLLAEFKRRLIREHGTLVRAWTNVLKPAGDGNSITFDAFKGIFEKTGVQGDAKAAWGAIDRKGKTMTLSEFDPGVDGDFRELRARIGERYGSMERAFDEVDKDGSYELDMKGFLNLCYECQFRRNERRLFAYLDPERLQRISLGSIDGKAVEAVKQRRAQEAEARALREGSGSALPEEDVSETNTPTSSGTRSSKGKASLPGEAQMARGFREQLQRRCGSMLRAWRMIDFHGKVALTKPEFARAIQATGYAGNASALWSALGAGSEDGSLISLRELDPEVFRLLASFRKRCDNRGGLEKAFQQADTSFEGRISREQFDGLCKKVRFPKANWQRLFELLDVRSASSVSWEDMRFLEEQWNWEEEPPQPVRNSGGSRTLPPAPASPDRTSGMGHLCLSTKPRIISGMRKSSSLPAIATPVRDNWNERHHIMDSHYNRDTQLLHLVTTVLTKDRERIKRRVADKMAQVSTMQWLEEQMPIEDDGDYGGSDDYDDDYDY